MSTVTSADGTVIDYDAYGRGPAVIFVAGAVQHRRIDPGSTAAARLLGERGFTTVVYDRRGRGLSGDNPAWTLQREVDDVAALVAACGGAASLYTSSSGATIALQGALAKVGVTGLMLYEPPFFQGQDKSGQVAAVKELLARDDLDGAMRYNLTDVVGVPPQVVDGMSRGPQWADMCAVAPTLVYDLSALNAVNTDPDWKARWKNLSVPVCVYSGTNSFPALAGAGDAVAAALPAARRRTLPGQDHNPAPAAIVDAVTEFHSTPQ